MSNFESEASEFVDDVIGALTEISKLLATLVVGVLFVGALDCWPVTLPVLVVAYGAYQCARWIKAKVKKDKEDVSNLNTRKETR